MKEKKRYKKTFCFCLKHNEIMLKQRERVSSGANLKYLFS